MVAATQLHIVFYFFLISHRKVHWCRKSTLSVKSFKKTLKVQFMALNGMKVNSELLEVKKKRYQN